MNEKTMKLSFGEKIGYGFGDLASVLYWQTFMLYFTYFYTDIFLIPASIAATMFLVSRIWDGINDPLMGMIADRTKTRWGKFRPYLLWLCVPFAVAGVLVFTVPGFGMTGKIIWAYVTFILIMMLYTAINIPYTSLLGVISADSNERTQVSSVKFLFAFAAGIIVSATLLPMAKSLGKGDESIINAKVLNDTLIVNEATRGNAQIILYAEDESKNIEKTEFAITVVPAEDITPQIVASINEIDLNSGFGKHEIDISDFFANHSGKGFKYKVESQNDEVVEVRLAGSRLEIIEKNIGNANVQITAKDKRWGEKTHNVLVNVMAKGNHDPVLIDPVSYFELKAGYGRWEIDLEKVFSDPDSDPLVINAESNNSKVITPGIVGNKLTFIEGNTGIADVSVIVSDQKGGRIHHSFEFLVCAENNNPPFIKNPVENIKKTVGFNQHRMDVSDVFEDPDGDTLTYSIEVINTAKGWQRSFIIFGIAAVIFFLITFKSTKERVRPPAAQKTTVKEDLFNLVTNRPWLILLATTITFILFVALKSSVTVHYFKYFIGVQDIKLPFLGLRSYDFETLTSAYNTIGQISAFIGVILVAWLAKVIDKKSFFIILFIIAIFSTGIVYFMTAEQIGLIYLFQITGSMTGGPLSVLIWAMYADTADYGEWKNAKRSTGLIFSASTMSQKFGWAIGAFISLSLMFQVGFQPNEIQSPESQRGLISLFSLIPAGMGVISIIILLIYPLTDRRVKEIETELIQRRKQRGEADLA
ncbi:MAG: MFS transporter [Bacteroidales bacterium]|nr:MFS transporter [Bacteroidales bacterium]